ncbi:hypothetical protein P154DRAFT_212278 [Amniculicola lignicola CBS 123094]|uniref:Uncharacterized protein n=1 Tax=Amniculicola lignicola CBS 123094 TaxID=1392246 RepID=A0A6A5WEB1_9PLEO|nr:hypothetical protein P154DRAFT_212278 [Amniculicola lignicola CBS 123094]
MSGLEIVAAIAALVSGFHAASELVRRLPPDTVSKLCCGFPRRGKRNALEYWLIRGEEVAIYLKEIHENRIAMYRHTHAEYDTVYTDEHMLLEYLVDVRIIIEQRIILVLRNSVNDSSDRADFKTLASIIQDADLGIIEVVEYIALVGHRNTDKYKTTISGTRIKLTKMVKVQRVGHFKLLTVPTWTKFHQYRLDFPNDYSPLTETYKPLADLSETDHTRKAKKRMQSRSQDAEMEIIPVGKLNDRSAATSAQKAYRGQSHAGSGRRKSTPDETHAPVIESALGYDKGSRGDRSYNDEPEVTPKPRYEYPNDVDDTSYHGSSKGHARSSKLSAERHGDDRKPSFCPGPIVEWDLDYDESGRHATSTQKEEEFEDRERTKTTDMSRKSASTPTVEHPSSHGRPRKSRKKERPQTLVGPSPPSHEPGRRPYKRSSAPAQSRGDNPIADVQRPSKTCRGGQMSTSFIRPNCKLLRQYYKREQEDGEQIQ